MINNSLNFVTKVANLKNFSIYRICSFKCW